MPEMKHWREDPEEELARLIQTNELTDFWTSNIHTIVEPGESAVIIKDGNIEEVLTQQRVSNLAGGFGNWLGKKLNRTKTLKNSAWASLIRFLLQADSAFFST